VTDDANTVDVDDDYDDDVDGNTIPAATARTVCEYLVKVLVEDPDGVEVDLADRRGKSILEVRVSPGDMGRVIGKRGRIAQSIRTVVRAAAARDGVDADVDFVE
jgi:predicted RNA-binding protein YlqC (UPF0109 family)